MEGVMERLKTLRACEGSLHKPCSLYACTHWMVECMGMGGVEITHEMHGHQMNLSMEANQIQGKHARHAHEIREVGKGANHGHKGLDIGPLWTQVKPKGLPQVENMKRLSLSLLLDQKWHFLLLLHL